MNVLIIVAVLLSRGAHNKPVQLLPKDSRKDS